MMLYVGKNYTDNTPAVINSTDKLTIYNVKDVHLYENETGRIGRNEYEFNKSYD